MDTCSRTEGYTVGSCRGRLTPLTLWAGGVSFRMRLYCIKCGRPATDEHKD